MIYFEIALEDTWKNTELAILCVCKLDSTLILWRTLANRIHQPTSICLRQLGDILIQGLL